MKGLDEVVSGDGLGLGRVEGFVGWREGTRGNSEKDERLSGVRNSSLIPNWCIPDPRSSNRSIS